jgi:peptidoglycan-associated lipoprotein
MRTNSKSVLFLVLLGLSLVVTSCGGNSKKNDADANANAIQSTDNSDQNVGAGAGGIEVNSDSDSGKAGPLQTVYFAFNSSNISSSTKARLDANAAFLKDNPSVKIEVEGHCDERGSVQYNLALGEKRAKAVKQYLMAMGVSASRISTISFGKERPISFGHDDMAWTKNRRANFVVTAK